MPIKRLAIYLTALALSWLVLAYPWLRLFQWADQLQPLSFLSIFLIWIIPVGLFIWWMRRPSFIAAVMGQIAVNWFGVSYMFLLATLGIEALRLFTELPGAAQVPSAFFILGGAILIYAIYQASHIKIIPISLDSDKLKKNWRLAHLSDIHLGSRSQTFLKKVIKQTNQLNPDMVLITGDLFDMRRTNPQLLSILDQFNAPVYYVIGNHERYIGSESFYDVIRQAGVQILNDESLDHGELQIIGINDSADPHCLSKSLSLIDLNARQYSILLYHKPEQFELAAEKQVNLMLCGHTHAGQIFPFNLVVKTQFPKIKGLYKIGQSILNVSQGTGTWGPTMRLGSRNEIALIELTPNN